MPGRSEWRRCRAQQGTCQRQLADGIAIAGGWQCSARQPARAEQTAPQVTIEVRILPSGIGRASAYWIGNPFLLESAMYAVSVCRSLACAGVLAGLVGLPGRAHADFIYARLVPGPGTEPNGASTTVDVSSGGRTVVFASNANNWVGDTYNGTRAVVVDLDTGVVEVVSESGGSVFRGDSPVVSGDGRYVAFMTYSSAFGPNWQVLRKDRQTGALELASATAAGEPASGGTEDNTLSISADGRYVAFQAVADMTAGHAGGGAAPSGSSGEIYVKDMTTGQVEMASVPSGGNCSLERHALSGTGRYLAMLCSNAMVPGASGGQAYVRDLQANTTELVSRSASAPNGSNAFAYRPAISPSGRFVSFQNRGYGGLGYANGVDSAGNSGLYLRDRQTGATSAIARPALLPSSAYDSCALSAVSDVGSVVFHCNYAWVGPSAYAQVFLFVPGAGAPELISGTVGGQPGNAPAGYSLGVNASGLSMAWESSASNVDPDDGNGVSDIFVLVEESVLSDTIFANGFDTAPALRQRAGRLHAVPIASDARGGDAARD
jgi:Tol biopolymer transport system component